MTFLACLVLSGLLAVQVSSLDNGLALTPPMGWLAWERFRCNVDCDNDPDNCIHENLFMQHADILAKEGYAELGYDIISLDDCWMSMDRDADGKLQGDPKRFPSGIKALADHVHSRGLTFGIYEDYGTHTCGGYPGIIDNLELDANTFAEWDVDYVKLDGCYADPHIMDEGYPEFGGYLNKTGRPMIYSCSWPDYQIATGLKPNWSLIIENCNLWRNYNDIQDTWDSVTTIINHYGDIQDELIANAGPGHWNDPDMLIIGNFGLSHEQSRSQMAIWAILAAPLLMSVNTHNTLINVWQNSEILAENVTDFEISMKNRIRNDSFQKRSRCAIFPISNLYYINVLHFSFCPKSENLPDVSVTLKDLGMEYEGGYQCVDLYDGVEFGTLLPNETIAVKVNPSGVVMVRCDVFTGQKATSWFDKLYNKMKMSELTPLV
ncbi:unnamed protein product, partial [Meganyctiphanes norvegica]